MLVAVQRFTLQLPLLFLSLTVADVCAYADHQYTQLMQNAREKACAALHAGAAQHLCSEYARGRHPRRVQARALRPMHGERSKARASHCSNEGGAEGFALSPLVLPLTPSSPSLSGRAD